MNLHEHLNTLNQDFFDIMDQIAENNGELNEELEQEYDNLMHTIAENTDMFVDTLEFFEHLKETEAKKAAKHEAKAKKYQNKIDYFKNKAKEMIVSGVEFDSDTHKITLINKETPSIIVANVEDVPKEYRISQPDKVDKRAWMRDIKNNKTPEPVGFTRKPTSYLRIS